MVKIKKIIFSVGIVALLLTSCNNGLQSTVDELTKEKEQLEKELEKTKDPDALTATAGSKSSDVIKVRLKDAQGFGTRWASKAATSSAQASLLSRSALSLVGSETLVKLNKDGTVEEALVLPEGLADWCEYQPVREVYQCTYLDTVADKNAKGLYIVFDWYIDWWKLADTYDEDGNVVPGEAGPEVGQLLYIKPDGTVVDVFAKADAPGKINKISLNTYLKENDDRDYIKFDVNGNAFMIITDYDNGGVMKIARFNPLTGETVYYNMPEGVSFIRNFELKSDGTFFYINAMVGEEGKRKNNVYAIPANATASATTLYETKFEDDNWNVSNLCYNPIDNKMFFFVDDWLHNGTESGLYICKSDLTKGLVIDKHYYNPSMWDLQCAFSYQYDAFNNKRKESATFVTKAGTYTKADGTKVSDGATNPNKDGKATYNFDAEYDYDGMLKYIKSFYGDKKVYFTLDYFKKYENAGTNGGTAANNEDTEHLIDGWFNPYENLYATEKVYDSTGKLLKQVYTKPATPHEYTDKDGNVYKYDYDWSDITSNPNADKTGKVLTETKALKYIMEYTCMNFAAITDANGNEVKDANGNVMYGAPVIESVFIRDFAAMLSWNMQGAKYPSMPLWMFITDKEDGTWNGPIYASDDAKLFAEKDKGSVSSGELVYTDDGVFLLYPEWKDDVMVYTSVVQVTNKDGNIVMTTPSALADIKGFVTDNYSETRTRKEGDPWYKSPIKANNNGFTLRSEDGKSVYYYDGTTCTTIVDGKKLNLATVYSFSLNNEAFLYNAVSMNGGSRTARVDFAKPTEETKFDIDVSFDTLLETKIPTE